MFRHDCPLAVKDARTPRRPVHGKTWRDSLPIDMLPFGVTIPDTVPQRSEIPEGLMNYSVFKIFNNLSKRAVPINSAHTADDCEPPCKFRYT
jgi:hypothetical protein